MVDALAKAFQEGGLFMYFIALCSAFAATIILERFLVLFVRFRTDEPVIQVAVEGSLANGKVTPELQEIMETHNPAPAEFMAYEVGRAIPFGPRAIIDAVVESRIEVNPDINKRTGYVGMLANVSTLLGLLGTIIGLIAAFAGVAAADPAMKQQMLATGISVAMNTTAYGLMVAIPCMISHSILMSRTNRVVEQTDMLQQRVFSIVGEKHPEVIDTIEAFAE